jgi:hypothetical protein
LFQIANICAAKTKARIRRRNSIKSWKKSTIW